MPLSEETLKQMTTEPHRPRSLSNVSAKSIEKATAMMGYEAAVRSLHLHARKAFFYLCACDLSCVLSTHRTRRRWR